MPTLGLVSVLSRDAPAYSSRPDVGDTEADLSSGLSAEFGSMSDAWEAGSHRPLRTPRGSVRLPDHIQDLHYLLIDDENYGHIQTHAAQPWNCPLVEARGRHEDRANSR